MAVLLQEQVSSKEVNAPQYASDVQAQDGGLKLRHMQL